MELPRIAAPPAARSRPAPAWRPVAVLALLLILLGAAALLVIGLNAGSTVRDGSAAPRSAAQAVLASVPRRVPAASLSSAALNRTIISTEGVLQMEMTPLTGKPPTWADLTKVYRTLSTAQAALAKYGDVQIARDNGYIRDPVAKHPRILVHFHTRRPPVALFKATAPRALMYWLRKRDGQKHFTYVGVMYGMPSSSTPQQLEAIFPPSMAMWHRHINVCLTLQGQLLPLHDAATCEAKGALFARKTWWMVHAWIGQPHGMGLFDVTPNGGEAKGDATSAAALDDLVSSTRMDSSPWARGLLKPLVMADGTRSMEMLPLTGAAPTWVEVSAVYRTLSAAQHATAPFTSPAAARRAGYLPAPALYAAGPGTHLLNPAYLAAAQQGHFSATRPPLLTYATAAGHPVLAGLTYVLPRASTPRQLAQVFPPSLASWQRLIATCLRGTTVLPLYDSASCAAQHGQFTSSTDWMVHAWIGQANGSGLFDMDLQQ